MAQEAVGEIDQNTLVIRQTYVACFVKLVFINEYKIAFANTIGQVFNKISPFSIN